jgi:hypothetical protein
MPNQNQKLISQANELRDMITIHPVFNDAQTQKAQSLQAFIGEGTRNGIQALLMAMAFSLVAGLRSGNHGIGGLILDLLDFGELLDACSAKPWGASKRLRKAHSLVRTGLAGLEPTTYGLGNRRSIRLSYSPTIATLSPAWPSPSWCGLLSCPLGLSVGLSARALSWKVGWHWKAGEVIAIGASLPGLRRRRRFGRLRKVRAPQWPGLPGNARCGRP